MYLLDKYVFIYLKSNYFVINLKYWPICINPT